MKTTHEIKKWCESILGLKVKGNIVGGRGQWQTFRIPPLKNPNPHVCEWDKEFPEEFRKLCLRTVYPTSPTLHNQSTAGNIMKHSIALHASEWETVMALWPTISQTPILKAEIERELSMLG